MTVRLIETIRIRGGVAPLWALHVRRLVASCRATGVPFPLALEVPSGGTHLVRRLEVGADGVTVSERPVGRVEPISLATTSVEHAAYPHKVVERGVFQRAAADATARGADDALLRTAGGYVAEATIWSLFWWVGDRLAAPDLAMGVLGSVSRLRLEELTGPLLARRAPLDEAMAGGLFAANAVRGIVPVRQVDGRLVVADARTEALSAAFWP